MSVSTFITAIILYIYTYLQMSVIFFLLSQIGLSIIIESQRVQEDEIFRIDAIVYISNVTTSPRGWDLQNWHYCLYNCHYFIYIYVFANVSNFFFIITDWVEYNHRVIFISYSNATIIIFIFFNTLRGYHTLQGDNSLKSVERFDHMITGIIANSRGWHLQNWHYYLYQ
jgi:hypothetical protein